MRRLLLAAAFGALVTHAASATTVRLASLPELTASADQVLQGHVVSARAVRVGGLIVTDYEVAVTEWLKPGPAGRAATVTLRQPGGTLGESTMVVVGAAHFAPGDDLLLFTKDYAGDGTQQVENLMQGALALGAPEAGGAGLLPRRRVPAARALLGADAPDDLDALKARVRMLLAEQP